MGGASKLIMLLSSPFPRPSALRRLAGHPRPSVSFNGVSSISRRRYSSSSSSFCSRSRFGLSITASEQLHSPAPGATTRQDFSSEPSSSGPIPNFRFPRQWPEWAKLEDNLRSCGYYDRSSGLELDGEDGISAFEELPEDFVRTVKACVLFARDRPELLGLVGRKDIEIVVEHASPFLFRSAVDSVRRMKAFLRASGSSSQEFEFEKAHTIDLMRFLLSCVWSSSDVESLSSRELVESSVQNLLSELADASRSVQGSNLFGSLQQQLPDRFGNTVRPPPYRQNIEMKRGDWICSKCNFMNFARNMKCLECHEARPKRQLTGGEWECPQCDFFNHGRNVVCLRCDCKRPGETSFQPASPRYGVGYSNENASYQGVIGSGTLNSTNLSTISDSVNQSLDRIHSRSSPVSETGNSSNMDGGKNNGTEKNSISRFASTLNRQSDGKNSNYVPFVPLPADMFAKPQKSKIEEEQVTYDNNAIPSKVENLMNPNSAKSSDSTSPLEKPVYPTESKEDKEQAEKSERWFKKVAELHDVPDLASAISDEDFPEIMPMRKGENRFVVSKKKDRSLTSPQYRRRMAMEQSSSTNYVPFVPFPPDYFAKKDKQPETEASTGKNNGVVTADTGSRTSDSGVVGKGEQFSENPNISKESANTSFLPKSLEENKVDHAYGGQHANPSYRSYEPLGGSRENWRDRSNEASPISSSSPQFGNSGNSRESWKGKSLEGSLVKEPDPFDMSEEAKAERWFRRAAQIKDISELSQIPDEDFPQIMPMRKGVNRFVVSKRKTPLERRLTSPQYRRNLPIVSSEPLKEENNER